jgi:5-methylcytosine-specific restriction endonuclease McrA
MSDDMKYHNDPLIAELQHELYRRAKKRKNKANGHRLCRNFVRWRDKSTCQYCGKELPWIEVTFDHVLPVSQGGRGTPDNLVVACHACNQKKGARTPEQANMPLRSCK